MLTDEQVASFERDGFLNGGVLLDNDEVVELRADLERVLEIGPDGIGDNDPRPVSFRDLRSGSDGPSDTPVWQIVNIWESAPAFEQLIYHPFIVRAISQLTGHRDLMVWHDQIQYKPAQYGGSTHWHQDAPLWPIIKPMTPVSAWIPLMILPPGPMTLPILSGLILMDSIRGACGLSSAGLDIACAMTSWTLPSASVA